MELSSYLAGVKTGESRGGGGYTLPAATSSTLGGVKIGEGISVTNDGTISASSGKTPIMINITDYLMDLFNEYYNNGEEYYEADISSEVQEQFDAAVTALNNDITTTVFFVDEGMPEYHLISNIQLGDAPFLSIWYHWAEPPINGDPAHIVLCSIGIQDGKFAGSIKKLDLNSSYDPYGGEGEPQT